MNCCDQNCHQGKDCPIREGKPHRKVRAGLPVEYTDQQIAKWDEELKRREELDRAADREAYIVIALVVALTAVVAAWLFGIAGIAP